MTNKTSLPPNPNAGKAFDKNALKKIYLAGGCFWGVEAFMVRVPGVADTTVGYANGETANPTYEEVCRDDTGHAETVEVWYDSGVTQLGALLSVFFTIIDPLSKNRQGGDVGAQYRTGVYYETDEDKNIAAAVFAEEQKKYSTPIVVELGLIANFYAAEEYHQDYLEKNPGGYCHVDFGNL